MAALSLSKERVIFYTSVYITVFGRIVMRFAEGHEALMRQTLADLAKTGLQLPTGVQPEWLTLGNVRTDIAELGSDRKVEWWRIAKMMWAGITCIGAEHPAHAMRCRSQSVPDAYAEMRGIIEKGFQKGCDANLSWEERALAFGSMLHTLQDSYCVAHAGRVDNAQPTSPLIAMYTYPSVQHPFTTKKDAVWQDKAQTAFKPEAAAAIQATVEALKMFCTQSLEGLPHFLDTYLAFRPDIKV